MEYIIITLASFLGSGLTFFSGFGLGTILVPVFAVFFPIDLAIILTAIIHFLNNIFKLILIGKYANKNTIIRFGITSVIGSIIGAHLLNSIANFKPLFEYSLMNNHFEILPVKTIIGSLIFVFALLDINPRLKNIEINNNYLPFGGFLSGFFGGLSGNQGALRTVFLTKTDLTKESFIATGVVLACLVDISRISVYSKQISQNIYKMDGVLILAATLSAFIGAYLGRKILKKVTVEYVRNIVTWMLITFSVLLIAGII